MSYNIMPPRLRLGVVARDLCRFPATAFVVVSVGFSLLLVALCVTFEVDASPAAVLTLSVVFSPLGIVPLAMCAHLAPT